MRKVEERGKRKEERKAGFLFPFFRFQILFILTRIVLTNLEPETFPTLSLKLRTLSSVTEVQL
jgi:hypothetical protein